MNRLQIAHAVRECILRRGGSNALFPNDWGGPVVKCKGLLKLTGSHVHWKNDNISETVLYLLCSTSIGE